MTPVRLECALGHETSLLLIESIALRQVESINDAARRGKRALIGFRLPEGHLPGSERQV
jgi:hypothetical protein